MTLFDPKTLSFYPEEPGVYLMKNQKQEVLYVGKAKNLKLRLKQYFQTHKDGREMIPYLLSQVETIDSIVTLTEKEALILENNLIKQHRPKYNVLLKDDKTFIHLLITKHKWPMLKQIRFKGNKPKQEGHLFGPYTNTFAARQTFDLIARLFSLRQCSDHELANRVRPCLLYDMKRCLAPCVNKCTETEYQIQVEGATSLLKGDNREIIKRLKQQMMQHADALEFEKADALLKTIQQIEQVTQVQYVDHLDIQEMDVLAFFQKEGSLLIAQLLFRGGKIIGSKHFSFHDVISSDEELIDSFLLQHYQIPDQIPSHILISSNVSDQNVLEEILSEIKQQKVQLLFPRTGKKKGLIEMALKNAEALFIREQNSKSLKEKMLMDLSEQLGLSRFPRKIECFDTSNIGQTNAVASLVCFIDGEKKASNTRLFKIKQASGDDYSSMKEVLLRHFTKEKERGDFADLVIVDGGKGQLNLALEVFEELGIAATDVIGLSKEEARHDKGLTQEKIYLPHQKDPLLIDPKSPLLFLLQTIRDEAHRTAIQYHRKKRSQTLFQSALDDVKGIGRVKKNQILRHFKSIKALLQSDPKELKQIPSLNKKDIEILSEWIAKSRKTAL